MGFYTNLKLLAAYWKVIKNPLDVRDFNEMTDMYIDPASYAEVFSKLNKDEASRSALQNRTQIRAIPPEAFHFYKKGTLGHAYKEFIINNKIVIPKVGFDPVNPVAYLRYRYRHYNHIWRIILGYDVTSNGQAALHAFLYAQTNSTVSMIYVVLSIIHCLMFRKLSLKGIVESVMDGWNKGRNYKLLWGVPLENHFEENLEEVRCKFVNSIPTAKPQPPRLMVM